MKVEATKKHMKYSIPKLPYSYEALEPYIDAKTMEIHHSKHHQAYVDKLNAVLEKYPKLADDPIESLLKNLPKLDMAEPDKNMLKNNGGGHVNHIAYWETLSPKKEINAKLVEEIVGTFSSLEEFKKIFSDLALTRFGSGWAWLVRNNEGKLEASSTPNQDSPHLNGHTPIFCIDVWEHAYYLKYQNRRAEYIENWWNVLKFL